MGKLAPQRGEAVECLVCGSAHSPFDGLPEGSDESPQKWSAVGKTEFLSMSRCVWCIA